MNTNRGNAPLLHIPVYFAAAMVADSQGYSPSAAKPAPVVEAWGCLGLPLSIIQPPPVSIADLERAHDTRYVAGILSGTIRNGFGNTSPAIAASLRYTNGAMLAAAQEAIRNGRVATAPCSGFHHAGYAESAGFCTFNGLMVTALSLHASGAARYVGILDFDMHFGDGTDRIIEQLGIGWIVHHSEGKASNGFAEDAEPFLARLDGIVETMRDCDVILYQAGADPHIDDPLGGWLTTEQLFERDRRVFKAARRLGIPIAWNLAGGYQQPLRKVLDIHDNTMRACGQVFLGPNPEAKGQGQAQAEGQANACE